MKDWVNYIFVPTLFTNYIFYFNYWPIYAPFPKGVFLNLDYYTVFIL